MKKCIDLASRFSINHTDTEVTEKNLSYFLSVALRGLRGEILLATAHTDEPGRKDQNRILIPPDPL
jgi:hypothetical protein